MSTQKNNTTVTALLTSRIAGITKYLTDPAIVVPVSGKACHPADLLAIFRQDVDARVAVDVAHASVKSSIAGRKTADATRRAADSALMSYVTHLFGPTSTEAQAFGYPAPKPPTRTVANKTAAIQKGAATRAARGTKGKAQLALIKGTTEVYVSPEAAAAAAQHVPAPAAGAPVTPASKAAPAATPPVVNATNGAGH